MTQERFAGPIAFVGAGPVAATLARAMDRAGLNVVAIASRDAHRAHHIASAVSDAVTVDTPQAAADLGRLVFLTVPDDAIAGVCDGIRWRAGQAAVHCSGATDLTALDAAERAGADVGAFHPLQMFANPAVALETLPGCTVTVEAAPPLDAELEHICRTIRCRPVTLARGQRALYHASANYVGPFLIALMQEAADMWQTFGASEGEALAALMPLLEGTMAAVRDRGLAGGMGGCVARGDVGTIRKHLDALDRFSPEAAALYRQLTLRTIPLAVARGTLPAARAEEIRAMLTSSAGG